MDDMMNFPKRWEDFLHDYEFEDARRIYTNGSRLIPSFRVKQMMEHYAPARHGQWEWFEEWNPSTPDHPRECEDCGWRCGKCKTALEDVVGGYWDNPGEEPKLRYCPNCGAKMDLEEV